MRKSGRLASIHEDDAVVNDETASKTSKKFVPTIPAARRKKIILDDDDEDVEVASEDSTTNSSKNTTGSNKNNTRTPLNSSKSKFIPNTSNSFVSGPLSLGPAAMARPSRSSNGSSNVLASRFSVNKIIGGQDSRASSNLSESIAIESEFSSTTTTNIDNDDLLRPIAISGEEASQTSSILNFEPETSKLFLFQMPPVLPSLAKYPPPTEPSVEAEQWPIEAQGRYGRLRRYKSGKLVLILENGSEFLVNSSIDSEKASDSSILAIDPEFAQCFNLGPLDGKFVCTPNFDK